jgi:uncharacterized protein (TIGR02145 family)
MKNEKLFMFNNVSFLFVLCAIFTLSCSKEDFDEITLNENGSIAFICGSNDPVTKTTLNGLNTHWIENTDKVGLFSLQASTTAGGAPGVVNVPLTAQSSGERAQFSGAVFWGLGEHTFYSYYPYHEGASDCSAVTVYLPSAQTQIAGDSLSHISALDFLISKPSRAKYPGVSGNSAAISLRYNHLFCILEFRIIRSQSSGDISKVKLNGSAPLAFDVGTINLTQEAPAPGVPYVIDMMFNKKNEVVVSLDSAITPTRDYETTSRVYMVILPETHTNDLKIGVESEGIYKEIVKSNITFERGKKYIVKVDADLADAPNVIDGMDLEPVTIGGVTWAPVNAGYDTSNRYGRYYQWHRKYGQVYGTINQNNIMVDLDTGNNPDSCFTFYTSYIDPCDWCNSFQAQWDMAVKYNPCPEGWRVPTQDEFKALSQLNSIGVEAGGGGVDGLPGRWMACNDLSNTSESVFLPASGYIRYSGESRNIGAHGYYWTVDTVSVMAKIFRSSPYSFSLNGMYKGTGNSVRCVKN